MQSHDIDTIFSNIYWQSNTTSVSLHNTRFLNINI